jgi:diadenylate cyclase
VPPPDRLLDAKLRQTLAAVAPGTALREGLERILRGRTGCLIVLGNDRTVEALCTGGFTLDVEFTSTGVRELAKMDGAIILDRVADRIHRAAVHLMPDHSIPSDETGTRHRTAQRVSTQTGVPVISVSASMHIIALYVDGVRYVLEDTPNILARANQALSTLERYKMRLDEVAGSLSALEIEDVATLRDVTLVAQRLQMVRRIASEIEGYVLELGTDGRLLALQLDELVAGVDTERVLLVRDYVNRGGHPRVERQVDEALDELDRLTDTELLDLRIVANAAGFGSDPLDSAISPRGHRLLARIPRLPVTIVDRMVEHFDSLQRLLSASVDDLQAVDGVGESRARAVREGMSRLAESSILERYV